MSTSETPKSPFTLSQPIGFGESLFNNLPQTTFSFQPKAPSVETITIKTTVGTGLGSSAQIMGSNRGGKITLKVTTPINGNICEIYCINGFTQGIATTYAVTLTPANVTAAKANAEIYCRVTSNKQFDIVLCGDSAKCFATYEWFYCITPY